MIKFDTRSISRLTVPLVIRFRLERRLFGSFRINSVNFYDDFLIANLYYKNLFVGEKLFRDLD